MVAVASYQKLSLSEKRALDISRVREQPVACPGCGVGVMAADLLSHVEQRCPGRSEPGPAAKWIGWREAVAIIRRAAPMSEAAAMMRLSRWSRSEIRMCGSRGDRKYLHGDLIRLLVNLGLIVVGTNRSVSGEP